MMENNAPRNSESPKIEVLVGGWNGHRLLDSGNRRKLEQFGDTRIIRSEPKAWWRPALPQSEWNKAVAVHEDDAREGRWRFPNSAGAAGSKNFPREWTQPLELAVAAGTTEAAGIAKAARLRLQLRFTDNSKQLGVFPEQEPHWQWLAQQTTQSHPQPLRLLNLFGYTGAATLAAAAAGWHVTHVDASTPAVTWARRNQELSGLAGAPIRWLVEDAPKFVQREQRRGNRYDALVLDPPAFGRGPAGELWKIERDLPPLLDACRAILSPRPRLILLTVYTIDASALLCQNLLAQMTADLAGTVTIGELALREEATNRLLPLSLWGRWGCSE